MALYINGTNIPTSGTINVGGTSVTKVYMNNTLVWSKSEAVGIASLTGNSWTNYNTDNGINPSLNLFQLSPAATRPTSEFTLTYDTGGRPGSASISSITSTGIVYIQFRNLQSTNGMSDYIVTVTLKHSSGTTATAKVNVYYTYIDSSGS